MLTLLILALTGAGSYVVYGRPWIEHIKHQRCLKNIARLEYKLGIYDVTPPRDGTDFQLAREQTFSRSMASLGRVEQWWALQFVPDTCDGDKFVMPEAEKRYRELSRAHA